MNNFFDLLNKEESLSKNSSKINEQVNNNRMIIRSNWLLPVWIIVTCLIILMFQQITR